MAGVIDTSEFRKGLKIEVDGEPFEIIEFQHVKPGKGSAFVRTSIKSLLSGRVLQPTFKSGDKVGKPDIEERQMQYLYQQGDDYYFMDTRNYEQTFLGEKVLGESQQLPQGEHRGLGALLQRQGDRRVAAQLGGPEGHQVRPGHPRRHGERRHQAGDARDRLRGERARSSSTRATC